MANTTVYPFGTEGSLPSSVGIVNDLITGGVDKALSAEQGKVLAEDIIASSISQTAKQKLIACLEKVAWTDPNAQTYIDDLQIALGGVDVTSITATFTQGTRVVFDTTPLDSLRSSLVVTGESSVGITVNITDYTLSGTLTVGTSTVTVSYENCTTTFTVTVTEYGTVVYVPEGYTQVEYLATNGSQYINLGFKINEAKDAYYVDFMPTTVTAQMRLLAGNVASAPGALYINTNLNLSIRYKGSNIMLANEPVLATNTRYNTYVSLKDNEASINGTSVSPSWPSSGTASTSSADALLCGPATSNPKFVGRIYACKIYRDGAYLRDMIPCKDSDGVGHFYDMYNDVMYNNAGSGSYTVGPDANNS